MNQRVKYYLFLGLGLALGALANAQTTYHVALSGDDDLNDGLSWAAPFETIHYALTQVLDDDTILISNGTYLVSSQIILTNSVSLRGAGTAEAVVIDGGGTGIGGQNPNLGWSLIRVNAAGARVENLTIKGGAAWWGGNGAGMRLDAGTVADCRFVGNYAGHGGALYQTGGLVTNCLFANNGAYQSGGAIRMTGGTLTHSVIVSNRSDRSNGTTPGGGIYMTGGTVRNSVISDNWSRSSGGGIHLGAGAVINCLITHNQARGYGGNARGGGLFMENGQVLHVTVADNHTIRGQGDGIYQAGG